MYAGPMIGTPLRELEKGASFNHFYPDIIYTINS
jgi:hypothetical protein